MAFLHQHPNALPFLFLTEMWERFGFYIVQGMLVLYMTQAVGYSDADSYTITSAFTALAYITPFIGGTVADRILGFKATIILGGLFLSLGYALLAYLPQALFFGLATVIVGNGLFKPTISSLLGTLYAPGNPNRDAGFTIFYIGIEIGIVLAGISSGFIKEHYGWHAGFGLASIGLLIGLFVFIKGLIHLIPLSNHNVHPLPAPNLGSLLSTTAGCILLIFAASRVLQNQVLAEWLLRLIGIGLLIFLSLLTLRQHGEGREKLCTLNILITSSIIFWMIYWQMFLSINLFIERLVNKEWLGIHLPTPVFYSLQGIFIILLGPLFAYIWQAFNRSRRNPPTLIKFTCAIILIGFAFLTLALSTFSSDGSTSINPLWIVLTYFLIAAGEMLISPIGLSAVTALAPPHLVGMMMGVWFVSLGFGGVLAGALAKLAAIPNEIHQAAEQLVIYRNAFLDYSYIAFAVAGFLFIVQFIIKRIYAKE